MAWTRGAKGFLKNYAQYRGMKWLGGYGVAASLGVGLYRFLKARRATTTQAKAPQAMLPQY